MFFEVISSFTSRLYFLTCVVETATMTVSLFILVPGTSWVEVESPATVMEALHVAVGVGVVWVVTKDYKVSPEHVRPSHERRVFTRDCIRLQVWFRRGVNSHNPCGSGWISIGGEMLMVDVGLNDQVHRFTIT